MKIENVLDELKKEWVSGNKIDFSSSVERVNDIDFVQKYTLFDKASPNSNAKFIVHGTETFTITINHMLNHVTYLAMNKIGMLGEINEIPFDEVTKRVLVVKSELHFKKPLFTNEIIVNSKITNSRNRLERLKMISMSADVDVGLGSHLFKIDFVINMRDDLV